MSQPLKWTGERLTTDLFDDISIEHLARYSFALPYVKDKVVLDVACGEGYGSHLLARAAKNVTGIDIANSCIEHAMKKYKKENLRFVVASVSNLPVEDNSVDMVVSFETLEHITDHQKMLLEIKRILKSDGVLMISTPDKQNYTIKRNFLNPFHQKELSFDEFQALLKSFFHHTKLLGQKLLYGSLITPITKEATFMQEHGGNFENITVYQSIKDPLYLIAICSNQELPVIYSQVFNGDQVLDHKIKAVTERYENSWSLKIGRVLTYPLRKIRSRMKKN